MKAARVFKERVARVTSCRFRDRREARVALIIGVHTVQAREYIWQRVLLHTRLATTREQKPACQVRFCSCEANSSRAHAQRATHWLSVITAFDRGEPIP